MSATRRLAAKALSPPPRVSPRTLSSTTSLNGIRRSYHYGQYKRFANNTPQFWQTKAFKYGAGGLGAFGTVYYVSHLEQVPITGRRRFLAISSKEEAMIAKSSYDAIMSEVRFQAFLALKYPR
ncbi:metalloendopeptidase [Spiromyces aspiralis]|uniref:Metalloendopeptidase n=1 Tax=Spiromyces aspiralis TaxID=68401 RepID=A0ACC1HSK6_9FUNG|nr:metalloendopeptidase [Spiromyces aspiralis]